MRIAILSCLYPYRGGISQFNASCLIELGKKHTVKAFNFTRQYPEFLFPGKTQYVTPEDEAIPVESERVLDTVNPFTWLRTVRAINRWKPDILIIRYWMPFLAPALGFVARHVSSECRVVGILDNVIPHERHLADATLTRYFLSGCDRYVTLCDNVAADLLKLKKDARYAVLPHPVYAHFGEKLSREGAEDALGIAHGMKNILFFGLIRDYKGLDILLDAFALLDDGYRLIIAGEPYGSFEKYRNAIDANPGKERISVYPRYIRDSEVKKYFSAADVTVLPYRSATQSGISSVSYHFEVPMIVTDTGGLREAVGNRGTGIVAAEPTPQCIADCIREFFADGTKRESYVENIRSEKVRLGWKKFCNDLISFVEE